MLKLVLAITLLALIGVSMAQLYDVYDVYPANGYGPGQLNTGIQQWGREYTVPRQPLNSYIPWVYTYPLRR